MNANHLKLVACLAWAGVAISGATPADALVETMHTGDYATCKAQYAFENWETCNGMFNYTSDVRFLNQGCSSGACTGVAPDGTWLDVQYTPGRKVTTQMQSCNGSNVYGFGTCAC